MVRNVCESIIVASFNADLLLPRFEDAPPQILYVAASEEALQGFEDPGCCPGRVLGTRSVSGLADGLC